MPHPGSTDPFDLITMGRVGVDLYPLQDGVHLEEVTTFGKYFGGSPTNDAFGRFIAAELTRLGVDNRFVFINPSVHTPITFGEILPPDDFPLYFYPDPIAPDLTIEPAGLDRGPSTPGTCSSAEATRWRAGAAGTSGSTTCISRMFASRCSTTSSPAAAE